MDDVKEIKTLDDVLKYAKNCINTWGVIRDKYESGISVCLNENQSAYHVEHGYNTLFVFIDVRNSGVQDIKISYNESMLFECQTDSNFEKELLFIKHERREMQKNRYS